MNWYSSCIRRICLIEGVGGVRYQDDVIILVAGDWREAREKAMAIGWSREQQYTNSEGKRVRWSFVRLITLDELGEIVDGSEVYSQPVEIKGESIPFGRTFDPGASEPTQSV